MGRYYYGSIRGRFWFGIQSSNDPEFFGCNFDNIHQYEQCSCICADLNIKYCKNCYSSELAHQADAEAEELILESNEIKWMISEDKINFVKSKLSVIESEINIHDYIDNIIFNKDNSYEYKFDKKKEFDNIAIDKLGLIAKWLIGTQIYLCLSSEKYCEFTGEI